MCGIVGLMSKSMSHEEIGAVLNRMNTVILHRGPDDSGAFIEGRVGLAMRRLSIIDLSITGHQPLTFPEAGLTIVYNGEVYNFKELRAELEGKGYLFRGTSDTEVVLYSYAEWGLNAFSRFNGMFALAIWDKKRRQLILARDRLGIKPLFLWHRDGEFAFASEMKAILQHPKVSRTIDRTALFHYLIYNSPPCPSTLLTEVKQLQPGTAVIISSDGRVKEYRYWSLPRLCPDHTLSESRVLEKVEELLTDSIRLRLRSDVPVGVFLSGGVDSSLITAIASKLQLGIKTFSIGYSDKRTDETQYAKRVANYLKTDHHTIIIGPEQLDCQELIKTADDPLANQTVVPYLKLAQFTSNYVKVALAGDGGDEFFCGYTERITVSRILRAKQVIPSFLWDTIAKLGTKVFKNGLLNWGFRISQFNSATELLAQLQIGLPLDNIASLIYPKPSLDLPKNYVILNRTPSFGELNYQTASTYLVDTVLKTSDRCTMHYSLEARLPFTDYRLVEFACRIPFHIQYHNGVGKYVLKKLLWKYVPRSLVDRPKMGFGLPGRRWLSKHWSWLIDRYLNRNSIIRSNVFNVNEVEIILQKYRNSGRGYEGILWRLIIFQMWYEEYIAPTHTMKH